MEKTFIEKAVQTVHNKDKDPVLYDVLQRGLWKNCPKAVRKLSVELEKILETGGGCVGGSL